MIKVSDAIIKMISTGGGNEHEVMIRMAKSFNVR